MSLRSANGNKWFWTVVWSSVGTVIMGSMCLKRMGLAGSDYPRIQYLAISGEYRTLLEPGAIPDNPYLPPHMRLDMRSYLDPPNLQIAAPPEYDLSITEKTLPLA